eukprot:6196438-Pleurochrysis_carterae.AAC.1
MGRIRVRTAVTVKGCERVFRVRTRPESERGAATGPRQGMHSRFRLAIRIRIRTWGEERGVMGEGFRVCDLSTWREGRREVCAEQLPDLVELLRIEDERGHVLARALAREARELRLQRLVRCARERASGRVCVCACVRVRECECACVSACVSACVRAC